MSLIRTIPAGSACCDQPIWNFWSHPNMMADSTVTSSRSDVVAGRKRIDEACSVKTIRGKDRQTSICSCGPVTRRKLSLIPKSGLLHSSSSTEIAYQDIGSVTKTRSVHSVDSSPKLWRRRQHKNACMESGVLYSNILFWLCSADPINRISQLPRTAC